MESDTVVIKRLSKELGEAKANIFLLTRKSVNLEAELAATSASPRVEPCAVCGGAVPCGEHGKFYELYEPFFTREEFINLRSVAEISVAHTNQAKYARQANQTTADEDTNRWSVYITTFTPSIVLKLLRRIEELTEKAVGWEEQSNRNLLQCEELQDQLHKARKQ